MTPANQLKEATKKLIKELKKIPLSELTEDPVTVVYNPLEYAWDCHAQYIEKYGNSKKKILLLGMNPGPWGMAQTGIPFGEIEAVKGWLNIDAAVTKPKTEHPKRPIEGLDCKRSEVSGRRLWGLFKEGFNQPGHFFKDFFVANYCPLVFMEESGRNRTPDKLSAQLRKQLFDICDGHLKDIVTILEPQLLLGVGRFAEKQAQKALIGMDITIGTILHPSPASPAANKDWAGKATEQFKNYNIKI